MGAIINKAALKAKISGQGYSVAALARKINIDKETIYNLINGKTMPSLKTMILIAEALRLSSDEIYAIFFGNSLGSRLDQHLLVAEDSARYERRDAAVNASAAHASADRYDTGLKPHWRK